MLPFLKPERVASTIISHRSSDGKAVEHDENEPHPDLRKHAEALVRAMHDKDVNAVARALEAVYSHMGVPDAEAGEE